MFITGVITKIDESMPRVRLKVAEHDNFETGWFFVPQVCTVKDKSHNTMAINTLVAACCSEDMQDGCIIGALYNDEDICVLSDENVKYIFFEDGTKLKYDKLASRLTADCVGNIDIKCVNAEINATTITTTASTVQLTAPTTAITGNVNITGLLNVSGTIISAAQICDLTGTMTSIRETYNSHVHGASAVATPKF